MSSLKGRIGEALVESILRQSGYKVSRLGRESQVQLLLRTGAGEFLPDFLIWKPVGPSSDGVPLHRLLSVEVKYRSNVEDYLRRFGHELLERLGDQWRELYVVLVTDQPRPDRSCFQVLDLQQTSPNAALGTVDLHEASAFGIGRGVIEEHERLVRQLFSPLASHRASTGELRRPLRKMSPGEGPSPEPGRAQSLSA